MFRKHVCREQTGQEEDSKGDNPEQCNVGLSCFEQTLKRLILLAETLLQKRYRRRRGDRAKTAAPTARSLALVGLIYPLPDVELIQGSTSGVHPTNSSDVVAGWAFPVENPHAPGLFWVSAIHVQVVSDDADYHLQSLL